MRLVIALFALLSCAAVARAEGCAAGALCSMGEAGEYRFAPPPAWDGWSPVGAFVFFHGHRASSAEMIAYRELVEAAHALGLLFIAPQGMGDSWSPPGSPSEGRRDELAYTAALLDDLAKRFPLDRKRIIASGFSQGASVVWEIACKGDGRFATFLPIAGVWWRPMPTDCPAPERPLLHIHGEADPVMPMTGRNLRDRWRQGDVREAFATMKRRHACPADVPRPEPRGPLLCGFEDACGSGQPLALCLHGGDHHTNPEWLMAVKDWISRVAAR
ncbi:MAG: alpha/beta hydrolase family esterase [Beijerinckiaceae bacterium]